MDASALIARARRKVTYVATTRRESALVAGQPVVPVSSQGRWRWYREHPRASRAELRRDHLRAVTEVLDAHDLAYFVVPDTQGRRPQVGLLGEAYPRALEALGAGLAGRAWYATTEAGSCLLDRLDAALHEPVTLHPSYRVAGSTHLAGSDLGVTVVPWRRDGSCHVAAERNDHVEWLCDADLEEVDIDAYGGRWRSVRPFEVPHADEVGPLTWVIDVPRTLRRDAPALADRLSHGLARSLWFHVSLGSDIVVVDDETPGWCRGEQAPRVHLRAPDEDVTRALVEVWGQLPGPAAVVPAGGLVLRDLSGDRVVSPGGLAYLRPERARIDDRPPELAGPELAFARRLQAWFEARTGAYVPWSLAAVPQGLPWPRPPLSAGLGDLLDAPDRPRGDEGEEANLLPLWWSYLQGAAVQGPLRATALPSRRRERRRRVEDLSMFRRDVDAIAADPRDLVDAEDMRDDWQRLLEARAPVPAPWE